MKKVVIAAMDVRERTHGWSIVVGTTSLYTTTHASWMLSVWI